MFSKARSDATHYGPYYFTQYKNILGNSANEKSASEEKNHADLAEESFENSQSKDYSISGAKTQVNYP